MLVGLVVFEDITHPRRCKIVLGPVLRNFGPPFHQSVHETPGLKPWMLRFEIGGGLHGPFSCPDEPNGLELHPKRLNHAILEPNVTAHTSCDIAQQQY